MTNRPLPWTLLLAAVAAGFAAGAFAVAAVVWRYGNVFGSSADAAVLRVDLPRATDRWLPETDEAGAGVLEPADPNTIPVGPDVPAVAAPAAPGPAGAPAEPVIGSPPAVLLQERRLRIPVRGVEPGELRNSFTERRGVARRHEAIDILAPRHTPVLAADAGKIARLFFSKAGGITIYQFDPGETFVYYYAHLERYADGLREGDTVRKGQIIGYVGTSGNAPPETPHLHFAILKLTEKQRWWEGTAIDPYDILTR